MISLNIASNLNINSKNIQGVVGWVYNFSHPNNIPEGSSQKDMINKIVKSF